MKLIVANWKIYLGVKEATHLAERIRRAAPRPRARVVLCPSAPALMPVGAVLRRSPYLLGAQDVSWEKSGPFTGEISPANLRELGCRYVIIGHSERRQKLGETDAVVRWKLEAALRAQLRPILCVGETRQERRAGRAMAVVRRQLTFALRRLKAGSSKSEALIVAYEPIWAIGTGVSARPKDAVVMHRMLRAQCEKLQPKRTARVIYGGSVDPSNARAFLSEGEVDGVLVGGASARPSFVRIIGAGTV